MAEKEYQRLTWSRRRPGFVALTIARASLWLGKDHLLYVETNGYTENYKRFYFRDIQAFTICRTNGRSVSNCVLGAIAGLLLLVGLTTQSTGGIIGFGIAAIVAGLIPIGINTALGPTCLCQLRTAVQTEHLPIARVHGARKILERIRPMIAAAQGQLAPEEIPARMQALATSLTAPAPEPARIVADDPNLPPRIVS